MALIGLHDIRLSFGGHPLFDGIGLQVEKGDRLCLLGRNGEGKSTLMKLIAGLIEPDSGVLSRSPGLRVALVAQDLPAPCGLSIGDFVLAGCEAGDELRAGVNAERVMDQLGLDSQASLDQASGGIKRRAVLARALASEPDLLLLDEPTNHLDIDTIAWLEEWLLARANALVFVTHDRVFARRVANRIAELDRGQVASFKATYDQFLERREAELAAEEKQRELFDKRLAAEEVWIRKGIKARRTRDEGRVKALVAMRQAARDRRERSGSARMELSQAGNSGDLVAEMQGLSFAWGERTIVRNLDLRVQRGDRIGIVGPNGAGKTTLVRLLLGELSPQSGSVRLGTRLEKVYYDQTRSSLDPERSVAWNLAEGDDSVMVNGKPRHVNAYLQDFLFAPDRARNPVSILSGGEKNRLVLARLFTRPANLLVLDEPTNDLDAETMDLLEDLLLEYTGTIILVSHDRHFLDNVVTSLLVMDGQGGVAEHVGGYSDWLERQRRKAAETPRAAPVTAAKSAAAARTVDESQRKLSYKEGKELEALPALIETAEAAVAEIHGAMEDPGFYRRDPALIAADQSRLASLEAELARLYDRWTGLESRPT